MQDKLVVVLLDMKFLRVDVLVVLLWGIYLQSGGGGEAQTDYVLCVSRGRRWFERNNMTTPGGRSRWLRGRDLQCRAKEQERSGGRERGIHPDIDSFPPVQL